MSDVELSAPARARWWWQVPLFLLFLLLTAVWIGFFFWLPLIPRGRREQVAMRRGAAPWARAAARLAGVRLEVVGGEHLPPRTRGVLVAANHESVIDIPVLMSTLELAFLMKRTLLLTPPGWGAYLSGSVSVSRGDRNSRARALAEVVTMAKRSIAVILFPEGTFGHADGRLGPPHLNGLRHAWDMKLPVVAVGHAGTRRAMDGDRPPLRRGAQVALVIRPPLRPEAFPTRDAFADACWREVGVAVAAARARVPRGWPYASAPGGAAATGAV
jgi:1-acyl-sn-glycerol-3-phosphate acyltransferase